MDELRGTDPLSADWMVVVLLLVFGALAWINMVAPKKWRLLWTSFFGLRLGKQSMRDELDLQDRTLIGLVVMSALLIAQFAYQALSIHGWVAAGVLSYLRILGAVAAVIVAQVIVLRAVGSITQADAGLGEYLYTILLFHIVLGLLLVPITLVTAFPYDPLWRRWLWPAGLALAAAVLLFRWFRATVIGLGEGVPIRYIFLYLCAAEILPVALLAEQARRLAPDPSNPF